MACNSLVESMMECMELVDRLLKIRLVDHCRLAWKRTYDRMEKDFLILVVYSMFDFSILNTHDERSMGDEILWPNHGDAVDLQRNSSILD